MTFTFSNTLPTPRDRIRHAIGDTNNADPLREDETIDALLVLHGEALATAVLAEGLASQYAREPDSLGSEGTSITWRERVKTWLALASRIRAELAASEQTRGAGSLVGSRGDATVSEYVRAAGSWWT